MLCEYKNIFGEPKKGVHKYRLLNVAIIDVIFTIIGAYIINLVFPKYKFIEILLFLFIIGIILHYLFCVNTTINTILFGTINQ